MRLNVTDVGDRYEEVLSQYAVRLLAVPPLRVHHDARAKLLREAPDETQDQTEQEAIGEDGIELEEDSSTHQTAFDRHREVLSRTVANEMAGVSGRAESAVSNIS